MMPHAETGANQMAKIADQNEPNRRFYSQRRMALVKSKLILAAGHSANHRCSIVASNAPVVWNLTLAGNLCHLILYLSLSAA